MIRKLGETMLGAVVISLVLMPLALAKAPVGRFVLKDSDQVVHDNVTLLDWQRNPSTQTYYWQNAGLYCTGGWRLPKRGELETIVDARVLNPALDPIFYNDSTKSASSDVFWSSSVVAGSSSFAWYVSFYNGSSLSIDVSSSYRVRCVRP